MSVLNWYSVYTKPRQETVARENLERQGFRTFLPLAVNRQRRRPADNPSPLEPLFPRYLFMQACPELQDLGVVRSTIGAVDLVRFGNMPAVVADVIITRLEAQIDPAAGGIVLTAPEPAPGDRVQMLEGPLRHLEAIFSERRSAKRAVLLVSLLGQPQEIEVDSDLLRRAG